MQKVFLLRQIFPFDIELINPTGRVSVQDSGSFFQEQVVGLVTLPCSMLVPWASV